MQEYIITAHNRNCLSGLAKKQLVYFVIGVMIIYSWLYLF